jgi:hypothetical protein
MLSRVKGHRVAPEHASGARHAAMISPGRGLAFRASALVALAALVAPVPARAAPPEPIELPAWYPPVEVGLGGHVGLVWGERCTREANDLVGCQPGGGLAGLDLEARYRVTPAWSIGVRGASSKESTPAIWWQGSVLARWHPLGVSHTDLWLGADAGLLAASLRVGADGLGPPGTITRTGAVVGLGAGIDFTLSSHLTLGPGLRGVVVPFGPRDFMPARGTSYATQMGAELGAIATARFGE